MLPAPVWFASASLLLHKLYGWKYYMVLGLRYILYVSNMIWLLNVSPWYDLLTVWYANLLVTLNDFFSDEKWILGDKLCETIIGKLAWKERVEDFKFLTKVYSKFNLDFFHVSLKICVYIYTFFFSSWRQDLGISRLETVLSVKGTCP